MERGAASIFVELSEGVVTVYHGTDHVVLHQVPVSEGAWNEMFGAITNTLYAYKEDTHVTS
jgi:hypothetical protein